MVQIQLLCPRHASDVAGQKDSNVYQEEEVDAILCFSDVGCRGK